MSLPPQGRAIGAESHAAKQNRIRRVDREDLNARGDVPEPHVSHLLAMPDSGHLPAARVEPDVDQPLALRTDRPSRGGELVLWWRSRFLRHISGAATQPSQDDAQAIRTSIDRCPRYAGQAGKTEFIASLGSAI